MLQCRSCCFHLTDRRRRRKRRKKEFQKQCSFDESNALKTYDPTVHSCLPIGMAKFFSRLFSRSSSFRGSQSSLNDTPTRSKTSGSVRTSPSLENLGSYHVISKELEKNKLHKASWEGNLQKVQRFGRPGQINVRDQQKRVWKFVK